MAVDRYAPVLDSCPEGPLIREAFSLSKEEQIWVAERNQATNAALVRFLGQSNLENLDTHTLIYDSNTSDIKIGLAFSGGGYRAMLTGAGCLTALDERYEEAMEHGLGGILQSSTYISGLSGGSWLLGAIFLGRDAPNMRAMTDLWNFEESILLPYGYSDLSKNTQYWKAISQDIEAKKNAGFPVSITDAWGRALFLQLLQQKSGDLSQHEYRLFSSLRRHGLFESFAMPFPIITSVEISPNTGSYTNFEFNPFEMGSWSSLLNAFVALPYLGSSLTNGVPVFDDLCTQQFDDFGFIMGTSSSVFNTAFLKLPSVLEKLGKEPKKWWQIKSHLRDALGFPNRKYEKMKSDLTSEVRRLLEKIEGSEQWLAIYPNSFFQTDFGVSEEILGSKKLLLADGSEGGQNIPLAPLIYPKRQVDVVFAFDSSSNTKERWPSGKALIQTYESQFMVPPTNTYFPHIPDANTFSALNFTRRPTFFGCYGDSLSDLIDKVLGQLPPLVIYVPNSPISYLSNTSTFKLEYSAETKRRMLDNGFDVASRNRLLIDPEWRACVACAVIRRKQERDGVAASEQCTRCFESYCWSGEIIEKGVRTKDLGARRNFSGGLYTGLALEKREN
ncbi:hypothetical protein BABINDRAFT_159568 [Babjeviella inositovora NRRL Y-12698]|uniref:Lysophospholipase n=1 Tax=Babjeviella inositovora NRRL Y-12698 TaxID=984486 RepID=A0A1E3QZK8_9ASCO|nr:uncharacterized protein BABINDRAFT_159568 [Babjeviella inositovora NRRL Y-12698]ODQ83110.1 hypothetical protein BABINDRAFT_159568 [Babjeviella inositovora NRRL Y-12698]